MSSTPTEIYTNAALQALEKQRNNALGLLVHAEASVALLKAKVQELEEKVAALSLQPELKEGDT